MSSRMPRAIQASRGNAPKDGTCPLTLSNMKTFMMPEAPYRSAARICRTHNKMFIVCLLPVSAAAHAGRFLFRILLCAFHCSLGCSFDYGVRCQRPRLSDPARGTRGLQVLAPGHERDG